MSPFQGQRRNCHVIWLKTAQRLFLILNTLGCRQLPCSGDLCSHNRLLRRQHCSSLCSQSEGHEHVANMSSVLGNYFVGFSSRAWPPNICPPLLRRQHCSSLCSQSEGHEHIANMASALGHYFVGFSSRAWPPQYSSPSLCEQSELQCFAPRQYRLSAHVGAETTVAGCRDERRWEQKRTYLGADTIVAGTVCSCVCSCVRYRSLG